METKCHICKGIGKVDGGNNKRILKEKEISEKKYDEEIKKIPFGKNEQEQKINKLKQQTLKQEKYNKSNEILNQKRTKKGECLYCKGTGRRQK